MSWHGPVTCQRCDRLVDDWQVTEWDAWIHGQVVAKRELPTRKQSLRQGDDQISEIGLKAELICCLALCPQHLADWQQSTASGGKNRGNDLRAEWLGSPKPIEVKQTPYCSDKKGFLLLRPPSGQRQMLEEYVDDCWYVLVITHHNEFRLKGWTDRNGFLDRHKTNPTGPLQPGQVECWGVLWSDLKGMETLPLGKSVVRLTLPVEEQDECSGAK